MAGRCPEELEEDFIVDIIRGLDGGDLAKKYGRAKRTIRDWKRILREDGKLPETEDGSWKDRTVVFNEKEDSARAASISDTIKTLDDLIKAANVDLSVWVVKDWGVKRWEVGAKVKQGFLDFSDGKIMSGRLDYKGIGVQELWSVWADFVPVNPIPVFTPIASIVCDVKFKKVKKKDIGDGVERSFIFADTQFAFFVDERGDLQPVHDREILDIWLQITEVMQPKRIIILGDIFDLPDMSGYVVKPEFGGRTQESLCEAHWWLRNFREANPNASITVHEGNHDKRLHSSVLRNFRASWNLRAVDELGGDPALSLQRLLVLDKLGIEWIEEYPDTEEWLGSGLVVHHGNKVRSASGSTSVAIVRDSLISQVTAHVHRDEHASLTKYDRQGMFSISSYSVGCSCRVDGVVPGNKKKQNWQQSALVVDFTDSSFSAYPLRVQDKSVIWDLQVFRPRDRLSEIRESFKDYNLKI